MSKGLFEKSTLFGDGKTQVPAEVRETLGLKDGDALLWIRKSDGWLVRGGAEFVKLFSSTLSYGGVTCQKCGTRFEVELEKCPRCGARKSLQR